MHVHSTRASAWSFVAEPSIDVDMLAHELRADVDCVLLDVRDDDEVASARILEARHVPLERVLAGAPLGLDKTTRIITLCATGKRAELARDALLSRGYADVRVARGGMNAWLSRGLPATGSAVPSAELAARYDRQMRLPEVGAHGQTRLQRAKVAVIGAGGLGCPCLLYLAAAGVGHLTLVDADHVSLDNLHRQVLYATSDVGRPKVLAAKDALLRGSPEVVVSTHEARLTNENAASLLAGHDVLVDATDNYAGRAAVNRASCKLSIPAIFGAVSRFEGEVLTHVPGGACYACLHPSPPGEGLTRTCAEEGVLGVVPGAVGLLQANEALKLLLGYGTPLTGRLLTFDAKTTTFRALGLDRDPSCPVCAAR